MLSLSSAALLLAALAPSAFSQTFSDCKDDLPSCPVNPAQKSGAVKFNSKDLPAGWVKSQCQGSVASGSDGIAMSVAASGDCPGIETTGYVFFGLIEFKVKAAPGQGIVSSMVLESAALDEVDWEFIGGEDYRVQANYFGKGNTTLYNRMVYIPAANNQQEWHTYGVNWTSAALTWLVDGEPVRTLSYADAVGGTQFPQTPMKIKVGAWAGGDPKKSSPGTVTWAGGEVDWSKGPFPMSIASANIVNYSPAESYTYGDNSGSWKSIKVKGGDTGGIVDPSKASAEQSAKASTAKLPAVSTGSGNPDRPAIETAASSKKATESTLPSTTVRAANSTAVSLASLTAATSASTARASSTTSSGPATATGAASSITYSAMSGVLASAAVFGIFASLFA